MKLSKDTKITIQTFLSVILIIAGIVLLFLGFHTPPVGQIHDSVLVAYGEVSTFAGSLIGIDASYKLKMYREQKKNNDEE